MFLPVVYGRAWRDAKRPEKDGLEGRLGTLGQRLGVCGKAETPWMLYLHLGKAVAGSVGAVKRLNSWIQKHKAEISPERFFNAVTSTMLERHGREEIEPPVPTLKDINKVIRDLTPPLVADAPAKRKRRQTTQDSDPAPSKRRRTSGQAPTEPEMGRNPDGTIEPDISSPFVDFPSSLDQRMDDNGGVSGLDLGLD